VLDGLLSTPVGATPVVAGKALDAWVSYELRRAGFDPDEVWPRARPPRVLPKELGEFVAALPTELRATLTERLRTARHVAPNEARVLGSAYVKQVDVLIAQWSRGPELVVSTKGMRGAFRKNLANRFEEAYGDAKNLRGRFPLCALGYVFLLRSTALAELGTADRAIDMLRRLQMESDAYDACCLLVAEWEDDLDGGVRILPDAVPHDLAPGRFFEVIVSRVLQHTPVDVHVEVRERRLHRELPVEEAGQGHPDDAEDDLAG